MTASKISQIVMRMPAGASAPSGAIVATNVYPPSQRLSRTGGLSPSLGHYSQAKPGNLLVAAEKVCDSGESRKSPATTWLRRRQGAASA